MGDAAGPDPAAPRRTEMDAMGPGGWSWASHPWVVALVVLGTVLLWAVVVTAIVRMLRPHQPPPPAAPPSPHSGEHPR